VRGHKVTIRKNTTELKSKDGNKPFKGKFTILEIGPIDKAQRKIIRDIMKWEDESAKSDFVISTGRPNR
jgi:hypothetical protein